VCRLLIGAEDAPLTGLRATCGAACRPFR
jgi:hypothetical protein